MSLMHPSRVPNFLQDGITHPYTRLREPVNNFRMPQHFLRQATIYSLPVELLTRIFILGANYDFPYTNSPFLLKPDQDYYATPSSKFQLLVSHVCHQWRQIALQTPSLWSLLHFREPAHISRAEKYLLRCPNPTQLLDILVDTVAERDHIPGLTLCRSEIHQIFNVICPHVKRWRAFHLKIQDHECKAAARQHLSSCGPAPNLATLQLYHFEDYLTSQNLYLATYRPPVKVFSNHLPSLKNVSLIGVNLPWEHSPYLVQLHNLELALHPENIRPPYEHWENMLRGSPDLRTLSLHYSGPRVANGDTKLIWPTDKGKIAIQSLENLSLTDLDPEYLCQLMGRLVLPGLKKLSLDLPDQDFTPFVKLISCYPTTCDKRPSRVPCPLLPPDPELLSRLPFPSICNLDTLSLTALETSAASLRSFLQSLQCLRVLEVNFASVPSFFPRILMEGMIVVMNADTNSKILSETSHNFPCYLKSMPTLMCGQSEQLGNVVVTRRIPLLPKLEILRMSDLTGVELQRLLQSREVHDIEFTVDKERRNLPSWEIPACRWILKWNERWKGKDPVLDQIVEFGWAAADGQRIFIETLYDDEDDEDDEGDDEQCVEHGNEEYREEGEDETAA